MAERREVKTWRCSNGHIMGLVVRNSSRIRQLILYREALDEESTVNMDVDVMAVIEGYVTEIRCSVCGSVRTWVPGQESMQHLLRQMRERGMEVPK